MIEGSGVVHRTAHADRRRARAALSLRRHRHRIRAGRAGDPGPGRSLTWSPPTPSGTCARLPTRLVVLGAGPVGCELGQAFARLGVEVALVDVADRILPREQPEAAGVVAEHLEADGVVIHAATRAVELRRDDAGAGRLAVEGPAGAAEMPFDALLVAVGRRVRASGIGLDAAGVAVDAYGVPTVATDLRTSAPHVFAVGDVTGQPPYAHLAAHHARVGQR
ncbi:MAG: FAD-dependent oxidoreductase [Thermoleophilaceae bacterium]